MAHWDPKRDRRWVEMMQECNIPALQHLVDQFDATGDIIYWCEFCERLTEESRKLQASRKLQNQGPSH